MAYKRYGLLTSFIVTVLVLYLTSLILGKSMQFSGFWGLLATAAVVTLLNFFLAPVVALLTCPLQLLTLGLARFLVSGLMIVLASELLDGFYVANYWWAVLAAVVISLLTHLIDHIPVVRKPQR